MTISPSPRTVLFLLTLLCWPSAAGAQEAAAEPSEEKSLDEVFREQSIYIPYSKLRWVFEKEGRGVFLPYEKFEALWRAARSAHRPAPAPRPPVSALITELNSEAEVEQDVVRVVATATLEVIGEGWSEVPLRLSDAFIRSASLDGQPARIVRDGDRGYKLLVEKEGAAPRRYELQLEYAKAFVKAPGRNSVEFQAPQASVNRWRIRIPQADVKVNIHPLLAAAEAPGEGEQAPRSDETVVLAFVGAAPVVRFDWTAKAEGATGLTPLASVVAQQQVAIDEGVMRTQATLKYDISRAALAQLVLEAPGDHKVTGVFDANVRQWEVRREGDIQKITVQLFQPALGQQSIVVELEKFLADVAQQELAAPAIQAADAGRQQGFVVVKLASGLQSEAIKSSGLLQVDAADLPKPLSASRWSFSYRYAALPFDLRLRVEKAAPRIHTMELVEAYVAPEQLTLDLLALYYVEQAGVFQLQLDIPAGYEVRQVQGRAAAGAAEAMVDSYHLQGEDGKRLLVNLARKALGPVGLFVELEKRLEDPNLLRPTGEASEIPVELPRAAPETIERSTGRLIVYAPESLRVNPGRQEGIRGISFGEALQGVESTRGGRFPGLRQSLAFGYSSQPVLLTLSIERRKPYITVRQLLLARIEAGVVQYQASFFYDIRYSGVKALRIDVPEDLAGDIRNQTPAVREKAIDPPPEDVAEGYVAWSLTGETELLGQSVVRLVWEQKIDELNVGKSIDLNPPRLQPMNVDRAWGQIVVAKAESLDVLPSGEPVGLRPIDPQQDVQGAAQVRDAALAFEFHDDWSLRLTATRYQLKEVKHTAIERAMLRMVVVRRTGNSPQKTAVQALYRMRSARQRLAVRLPEGAAFDTAPLRINGAVTPLEQGDEGDYSIPLVGQTPDEPFFVELRYTVDGGEGRLDFPEFPSDPAVQKVYLCVYLPQELALLGYRGPWSREPQPRFASSESTAGNLADWVREGVERSESPPFPTDGRLYVFSTLRPQPPPDGSLRLIAFYENWVHSLVFAAFALVGVVTIRRSLTDRLIAAGVLLTALVLAGVFLPTFSASLFNGVLAAAVFLVIALWLIASAVQLQSRRAAARSSRPAAAPRPTAEAPAPPPAPAELHEPGRLDAPPGDSPLGSSSPEDRPPDQPAEDQQAEREGDSKEGGSSDA